MFALHIKLSFPVCPEMAYFAFWWYSVLLNDLGDLPLIVYVKAENLFESGGVLVV